VRVLFISKPIAPPFHDGTKCLVRDVATSLTRVEPMVLATRSAPPLTGAAGNVELVPIYDDAGDYAPGLVQNLRACAWVLLRSRADVWHFVFAPNPRASAVGRWLRRARKVPVVQTIASPPRSFDRIDELLFGDVVVAQSEWTRRMVLASYTARRASAPRIVVIPPPVPLELEYRAERAQRARSELGIPSSAPLFVYPGDLEFSSGARVTAEIAKQIVARVPGAVIVFAYRKKTDRAEGVARRLADSLDPAVTRVVGSLPDVLELIAGATGVLFPVDDLYGKVDLPIVLLESMVLGVPVVVFDQGPLADLDAARRLSTLDPEAWVTVLAELAREPALARAQAERQQRAVRERHGARAVAHAYEELYLELASKGVSAAGGRKSSFGGASTSKSAER
jgi:phosphatidylinositol alpha-1,6-mannosyltransferase